MAKKLVKTDQPIVIPGMNIKHSEIFLVSDSPLISHRWSEKSKKEIRDKQQKKAKTARDVRDPNAEFEDSLYHIEGGGYGFPAVAFKAAAVNACSHVDGVTKVHARGAFHIMCELVKIEGDKPVQREDMVRVGMGVADLRYRGEFKKWHCKIPVRFNANVLSLEQITNIFDTAGFSTGVGEWRPQKNGDYGMFHVARGKDENKLREAA
jgi:hypothetical protein